MDVSPCLRSESISRVDASASSNGNGTNLSGRGGRSPSEMRFFRLKHVFCQHGIYVDVMLATVQVKLGMWPWSCGIKLTGDLLFVRIRPYLIEF